MQQGFVHGGPRLLLRIEGLAYGALALIGYAHSGYSWWLFAALILVPDVSMVGYLINPSIGAASYNLVHTLTLPILLLFGAALLANMLLLAVGTIWVVHIGDPKAARRDVSLIAHQLSFSSFSIRSTRDCRS
jgi:hypothetical protein